MRKLIVVTGLLFNLAVQAIQISGNNEGDALIIPFYTVENGHKSVLTISNNTNTVKAVKVIYSERFLERETLVYNVYLPPMQSYSVEIDAGVSTRPMHIGEPTAIISNTGNNGCVPYIYDDFQFIHSIIDYDQLFDTNMDRAQTGTIAIIDMGEVVNPEAQHVLLTNGVPNDCQRIADNWNNGQLWDNNTNDSMSDINGGLSAELQIVNLNSNAEFNVSQLVFNGTFSGIFHTHPGNTFPLLTNVDVTTNVIIDGQAFSFYWFDNSTNHFNSLLQKTSISSNFDFTQSNDTAINWVVSLINKESFVINQTEQARLPFQSQLNVSDQGACDELLVEVRDEFGELLNPQLNEGFSLCEAVNFVPIMLEGVLSELILDDANRSFINVGQISKGSITLKTKPRNLIVGVNANNFDDLWIFYGLPMMGFQLTRLDDGINPIEYQKQEFTTTQRIVPDLIFANGIE